MSFNKSDIARRTGLSRPTITNILNKKQKNAKAESLKKIADALNCTVDDLLQDQEKVS